MTAAELLPDTTPAGLSEPRPASAATTATPGVPWGDLLPPAVLLSLAGTFWMVVLRVTAGPAIRTDAPFAAWLRESAVLLPCYVLAVLAAALLVLRHRARASRRGSRQGPSGPREDGGAVAALLTVTGAGVVTGVLALAASTGWDWLIERRQVVHMASMRSNCDADCIAFMHHGTSVVQLKAIGYGSVAIVVTDVVLMALLVGFRGGRLRLAGARVPAARSRVDQVQVLLVLALLGSAVVHAAVLPEHLEEWPLAAAFFGLLVVAEVVLPVVLLAGWKRSDLLLTAVAWLSIATVALWAWSRTLGLPFGPEPGEAEAVGLADVAATSLELASLLLAVVLLRRPSWLARPAWSAHGRALGVATVVAVTVLGVAGSSLAVVSAYAPVSSVHTASE